VSSIVAKNELFERYGDRPVQPPLRPGTWVSPTGEEESDDDDQEPDCRIINADEFQGLLDKGSVVVHHWATWCESCLDEAPFVRHLHDDCGVPVVSLSWDAFEAESASTCLSDVASTAIELGMGMHQYVLDADPSEFFKQFKMTFQQVPQTWLVDGDGERVLQVEGMMDEGAVASLLKAAERLA